MTLIFDICFGATTNEHLACRCLALYFFSFTPSHKDWLYLSLYLAHTLVPYAFVRQMWHISATVCCSQLRHPLRPALSTVTVSDRA